LIQAYESAMNISKTPNFPKAISMCSSITPDNHVPDLRNRDF
jgi:hypothetical protein